MSIYTRPYVYEKYMSTKAAARRLHETLIMYETSRDTDLNVCLDQIASIEREAMEEQMLLLDNAITEAREKSVALDVGYDIDVRVTRV